MRQSSQLARLSLTTGAIQSAAVLAWILWWWPRSAAVALAGAALFVSSGTIVLAIEFVLLAFVQRGDTSVPAPRVPELACAWGAETREMFRVFYWRQPLQWREPEDFLPADGQGRQGVVFIHGFVCNRGFWAPWLRQARLRGHPCIAVNLEPVFTGLDAYSAIVEAAVRRIEACTGVPPVLVCHSMGGLVARGWLRDHRAARRVGHLVTIASPHRGTWLGRFSRMPNGRQMQLASPWLRQLQQDEAAGLQPPRTCWYSNCDNIVFPAATATLAGADNRFHPGAAHVQLAFMPRVMKETFELLSASAPRASM